jgi:hypothetical protein
MKVFHGCPMLQQKWKQLEYNTIYFLGSKILVISDGAVRVPALLTCNIEQNAEHVTLCFPVWINKILLGADCKMWTQHNRFPGYITEIPFLYLYLSFFLMKPIVPGKGTEAIKYSSHWHF